jgi:hypothetical protein
LLSSDTFKTFTIRTIAYSPLAINFSFLDLNLGFAFGGTPGASDVDLLKATDGGNTWLSVNLERPTKLISILTQLIHTDPLITIYSYAYNSFPQASVGIVYYTLSHDPNKVIRKIISSSDEINWRIEFTSDSK